MTSEAECRRAADGLLGQTVASVTYVGLAYDGLAEVKWDYGDWHWPEVGIEFATATRDRFFAIWDSKVTNFELTFARGPISTQLVPSTTRAWDVTQHPRWATLIGQVVSGYELVLLATDDSSVVAPVGIRFSIGVGVVWILAAAPRDEAHATDQLDAEDLYLGHDEVIVAFGDESASRLGVSSSE